MGFLLPDGTMMGQVRIPIRLLVPKQGSATLPSDIVIDETLAAQAMAANADWLIVTCIFFGTDETGEPLRNARQGLPQAEGIAVPLTVRITRTLGANVSVNEVIVDEPLQFKQVGRNTELRAHAFIRGVGSSTVVGR